MAASHGCATLYELFGNVSSQLDLLHCAAVLNSLWQQQLSGEECDFKLIINSKEEEKIFYAHKCVLASISDTVKQMKSPKTSIQIQSNVTALQRFLSFIYTGKVLALQAMTVTEIDQIWNLATHLKANPLLHYLRRERPDFFCKNVRDATNEEIHNVNNSSSLSYDSNNVNDTSNTVDHYDGTSSTNPDAASRPDSVNLSSTSNPKMVSAIAMVTEEGSDGDADASSSEAVCDKEVKTESFSDDDDNRPIFPSIYFPQEENSPTDDVKDSSDIAAAISKPEAKQAVPGPSKKSNKLLTHRKQNKASSSVLSKTKKTTPLKAPAKTQIPSASRVLKTYDEEDLQLLRELKHLAPNANLWTVMPPDF